MGSGGASTPLAYALPVQRSRRAHRCPSTSTCVEPFRAAARGPVGRQDLEPSVEAHVEHALVHALQGDDATDQNEAALAMCVRAQEEGMGFGKLVEAGVLRPLVSLVSTADEAARSRRLFAASRLYWSLRKVRRSALRSEIPRRLIIYA